MLWSNVNYLKRMKLNNYFKIALNGFNKDKMFALLNLDINQLEIKIIQKLYRAQDYMCQKDAKYDANV